MYQKEQQARRMGQNSQRSKNEVTTALNHVRRYKLLLLQ